MQVGSYDYSDGLNIGFAEPFFWKELASFGEFERENK